MVNSFILILSSIALKKDAVSSFLLAQYRFLLTFAKSIDSYDAGDAYIGRRWLFGLGHSVLEFSWQTTHHTEGLLTSIYK
ncbi:unnamed protein product [Absidia cylindrospora]